MRGTELIVTAELAARVERALGRAAASRIASADRAPDVSLGVEVRHFGPVAATLVRHPRWYYRHFAGLTGLAADDWMAVDEAAAWLRSAGAAAQVYLSPYTAPSGAGDRFLDALGARGFLASRFMSVLAAPAGDLEAPDAPGLEVREVGDADRDAFLDIWLAPVETPDRPAYSSLARHEFADWRAFIALLDGKPAGVGSMFLTEGVGVLAGAVTLPHLRGRGVQTALLRRRIAEAAGAGCDLVAAQASPGTISERNMQRVGLRPAFGQVLFAQRSTAAPGDGETDGG